MLNQNLARGAFLAIIAVVFGSNALRLQVGDLARAGPGLFPLLVSGFLLVLAGVAIVQSRLAESVPLHFNIRNIVVIMLGLCGFVLASKFINMMVGIALLVFLAGFAATTYSWKRNVQVSLGLILLALAFQKLLGLNLRLI